MAAQTIDDPSNQGGTPPSTDPNHPSWLPPGATLNQDGSITLADGSTLPVPPGMWRDPASGNLMANPGVAPPIPGGDSGPQPNSPYGAKNVPPPPPATPPPPGGGGGPDTGPVVPPPVDLGGAAGIPYVPPTPVFTPPDFKTAPAFTPTTAADVANDPSFLFREQQGEQQVEQSAAARGVLNSGGTLKDILNYGQNAASQEFQDIDNRRRSDYTTNYQTQYTDPYQYSYQAAKDAFAPIMTGYQTQAAAGQAQTFLNTNLAYQKWFEDTSNLFKAANAN